MAATKSTETQVLIVGAGPVGLALACELLRRGIRCRVVEKYDEFPVTSRALGFQARTIEVFRFMGIADTIVSHSIVDMGLIVREGNRVLVSLKMDRQSQHPDQPYRGVWIQNQAETEALLREHLATLGGAVERSTEFTAFQETGEGIVATLKHTHSGEEEEVHASFLAGCDGAHSQVRQLLGMQLEGKTYTEHLALADVDMETEMLHDQSVIWLNDQGMLGAIPFGGPKHWRLFAVVSPNEAGEVPQASLELFERLLVERAHDTTTRLSNPIWVSNFAVHRRMAKHYRKGRVFLAGDAAHIHSPSGGQGMNTGIQDAFNLAWKLTLVLKGKADPALLDTYEEERLPVAKMVLDETDGNFKAFWSQNPVFTFLRDHALFQIMSLPAVAEFIFYRGSELNIHYRTSSLAVQMPHAGHALHAGDRAPDAHLQTAAHQATTIFDQYGTTRFTLLIFSGNGHAVDYGPLTAIADRAQALLGDEVQVRFIVSADEVPEALGGDRVVLLDPHQQASKFYDAHAPALCLVRPDGYVGLRCQPAAAEPLAQYVTNTLGVR